MPRSLKVVITCDHCEEGIDTDSEQHPGALAMTINGGPLKQIDLCGHCLRGENSATPAALVGVYDYADAIPQSKPAKRNTNQSQPSPCPVCDHVAGSAQGLGRHARTEHGATVAELRARIEGIDR